jgi:hypothetical protein
MDAPPPEFASGPAASNQASRRATRSRGLAALLGAVLVAATCASPTPPASPSASEEPTAPTFTERPWSAVASGRLGSGSVILRGVAAVSGTVVAVGVRTVTVSDHAVTEATFDASTRGGPWAAGRVVNGSSTGWVEDLIAYSGGFVAVGWDACQGIPWLTLDYADCRAVVWTSADGLAWSRFDDFPYADGALTSVVAWNGELLAAGSHGLVLHSADGHRWERLNPPPASADAILGLATDGTTVIAVGTCAAAPVEPCGSNVNAWVSADGSTWSDPETLPLPADFGAILLDVAATASGYVTIADGASNSAAWRRTTDGWTPLAPFGGRSKVALMSIASSPAGALIVGYESSANQHPVLFGSRDGAAWAELLPSGVAADTPLTPFTLAWSDDRFLLGADLSGQHVVLEGVPHLPTPAEVAAATPLPTLPPQVMYQARASTSAQITGVDGLEPTAGSGACVSQFAKDSLGRLVANHLAEFRGGSLQANFEIDAPPSVGMAVTIRFNLEWADLDPGSPEPSWQGDGQFSAVDANGMRGTVTFTDLPPFYPPGTPDAWPTTISGSLSWECQSWEDPDATLPPADHGSVTATVDDPTWVADAGSAMCSRERYGALAGVSGTAGNLRGSAIKASLSFSGGLLVAEPWVRERIQLWLSVSSDPIVNWFGPATIVELAAGGAAGRAEFSEIQLQNEAPGWPALLSGAITWTCG